MKRRDFQASVKYSWTVRIFPFADSLNRLRRSDKLASVMRVLLRAPVLPQGGKACAVPDNRVAGRLARR